MAQAKTTDRKTSKGTPPYFMLTNNLVFVFKIKKCLLYFSLVFIVLGTHDTIHGPESIFTIRLTFPSSLNTVVIYPKPCFLSTLQRLVGRMSETMWLLPASAV